MSDLPDPLVPADVDLRGMEFMPLYGDRLFASATWIGARPEAKIAALRLWWHAYAHEAPAGSLPADDTLLADYAGYGVAVTAWRKVRAQALRGWIECSDRRLYHPFLAPLVTDAWASRQRNRARTRAWRERSRDAPVTHTETVTNLGQGQGQGQGEREGQRKETPEAAQPPEPAREDQETGAARRVIEAFDAARVEVFGETLRRPWPSALDLSEARALIAAGADIELCHEVFRARFAAQKSQGKQPANTLNYMHNAVVEAATHALTAIPQSLDRTANKAAAETALRERVRAAMGD